MTHAQKKEPFFPQHEKIIAVTWANLQSFQIFSFWGSVCSAQAELSKAMISVKVNNLTYHTWVNTMEQVLEKYGCISNVYILQGHFTRVLWLCLHLLPQVPYHHGCPSWDRAGWPQTVDTDGTHQLPTDSCHGHCCQKAPPYRHKCQNKRRKQQSHSNSRSWSWFQGRSGFIHIKSHSCSYSRSPSTSTSRFTQWSKSKSPSVSNSSFPTRSRSSSRSLPPERKSKSRL